MRRIFTLVLAFCVTAGSLLVAQTVEFSDDFENGTDQWSLEGVWGLTTAQFNSGANSLTDSPAGNYAPNINISATLANTIDLSSALDANLSFWAIYEIENSNFDYLYVDASTDGGTTWVEVTNFFGTGNISPWVKYDLSLGGFVGSSEVLVRFRMNSDGGAEFDGFYLDDVEITSFDQDNAAPLILHTPNELYESAPGDVTITAELVDISGVASSSLQYTLDGGAQSMVSGSNVGGDMWEYVIPEQVAGTNVSYLISATDNSANANVVSNEVNTYIAGQHEFFDSGITATVNMVAPGGGIAVRFSLDDRKVATALIRNYTDENRPNDSIAVHVWADNNGLPGDDLITPVVVFPEANLLINSPMTRVDLRDYSELEKITGDVFVGYTVPLGEAWFPQSAPAVGNRSFALSDMGWAAVTANDFHIRLVTADGVVSNIEELIFDQSIALFPNPTSGETNLRFDLESSRSLQINVTNTLGQAVDYFSLENMTMGNVSFDSESWSAGLYYINITDGSVMTTKKLIKQ